MATSSFVLILVPKQSGVIAKEKLTERLIGILTMINVAEGPTAQFPGETVFVSYSKFHLIN